MDSKLKSRALLVLIVLCVIASGFFVSRYYQAEILDTKATIEDGYLSLFTVSGTVSELRSDSIMIRVIDDIDETKISTIQVFFTSGTKIATLSNDEYPQMIDMPVTEIQVENFVTVTTSIPFSVKEGAAITAKEILSL